VPIGAGDGRRISDLASIGAVRHAFLILGALRHGTWLRLPLRKLNIERVGLLHDDTSTATYAWMAVQRKQQALTRPTRQSGDDVITLHGGGVEVIVRLPIRLPADVNDGDAQGRDAFV
jgi:hypothetical protein